MKFRVILTYEYEPVLSDYDTTDPAEMAAIDEENFNLRGTAQSCISADLDSLPFGVTVEPVKE